MDWSTTTVRRVFLGQEWATAANYSNETVDCNSIPILNSTLVITEAFQGIPQNFLINFVVWLLLLLLFAILRKNAWNYGRIALVQKHDRRWTQLFYGEVDGQQPSGRDQESAEPCDVALLVDKGLCSWVGAIFRVKDRHILRRNGPDAIQYLSFQRYIIAFMSLVTVVSLVVVLPINFQGNLGGDATHFGHTTISNLDPSSPLLWIHVLLSVLLLPVGVYFMRHFSVNLKFEEQADVTRTLMVTDVPKDSCKKNVLLQHFREAYPEAIIQDIQLAYNIKEVMHLDKKRESMYEARKWSEDYLKKTNERLLIHPFLCNWAVSCIGCRSKQEDAITYYSQKENALLLDLEREKEVSLRRPLGICFVTLQTEKMATKIRRDHEHTCKCGVNPPTSSVSRALEPYRWGVSGAPYPADIHWENLSPNSEHWYLRGFCINFFMFVLLFFLTTPFVVITSLDILNIVDVIKDMSPVLYQFLPTLLLWTVAALMPVLVAYSDQFVHHWTRSSENHTVMRKTFIFLLFMIVILPSLGLTSAKAFVEWAVTSKGQSMRWECVFLPDNGVFYVNYVVTSAFIGTALELIRFPELFVYMVRMCATRSIAERPFVRRSILWEFPFGTQYAWFLLVFATTVIYSISCPLITPFGLVYMCLKHLVDRHNIIFAYGPSKISKSIHATAINFVVFSILLLQLMILFFTVMRKGLTDITIFSITFFCITSAIFIGQIFFNVFKGFSPILYTHYGDVHMENNVPSTVSPANIQFYPNVLNSEVRALSNGTPREMMAPRTYGTNVNGIQEDCVVGLEEQEEVDGVRSRGRPVGYQGYSRGQGTSADGLQSPGRLELSRSGSGDVAPHPI